MNTFDFDKTIFYPDSSVTFVKWYMRRHTLVFLCWLPRALFFALLHALKIVDTKRLKENLFRFVRKVPNIDAELKAFWDEHESRISPWYLKQRRDDDLVISASPEFVVKPMTDRMGVSLLATPMDKKTGKIMGLNCRGEEKVRRFYEAFPDGKIEAFYSDSFADTPMARIADKAYLIVDKGQTPIPWPEDKL